MRKLHFLLTALGCLLFSGLQAADPLRVYVGAFTSEGAEGISLCTFNPETGDLALNRVFKGIDNPNFLRKSPDGNTLYVVSRGPRSVEPSGGTVSAYRIGGNGDLSFLNKQSTLGEDPCYVDISGDGKQVVVANYGGGSVALFPVADDGALLPASSVVKHQGSGLHKARQSRPFAHSIRFAADDKLIYAADLGADKLFVYTIKASQGKLVPSSQPYVSLPPGSGPRHFEFSADGKFCYVVNELASTVTVMRSQEGVMTEIQTLSALPEGYSEVSYCADIHLSSDGKYVYASNRGHNSIAVFLREESGKLVLQKTVSTEGNWPRNFGIDPSGKYMLVANQRSHNIAIFRMEQGVPVFTGKELATPAPVCIEFL